MNRKTFASLALLGLSSFAFGQHTCLGDFHEEDNSEIEVAFCTSSSSDYLNHYRYQDSYVPDAQTSIKTLDVAIHVWRDDNGLGNWQDTPADRQKLQAYVTRMSNDIMTFNDQPSDIISGVSFIQDTKLRVNLVDIYYYDDSNYHTSRSGSSMNERAIALNPDAVRYINIHMSGDNTASYAFSGSSSTINLQTGWISPPHEYIWTGYRGDGYGLGDGSVTTTGTYIADGPIAQLLTHELGHNLGLCHTYCCANCTESNDPNSIDFLDDVFTPPLYAYHLYSWSADAYSSQNTATNNIMGGNKSAGYFSPNQIGRIHRNLHLNRNLRTYAKGFSSIPLEVTGNET